MFDDDDENGMFGESTPKVEEIKKKEDKPKHKVSLIFFFDDRNLKWFYFHFVRASDILF